MNKQFRPFGYKGILIQLDPIEQSQSTSGLYELKYAAEESDGSRPKAVIDTSQKYGLSGTVLAVSSAAAQEISKQGETLKPKDRVIIQPTAKNTANWVLDDPNSNVPKFNGKLQIMTSQIQSIQTKSTKSK